MAEATEDDAGAEVLRKANSALVLGIVGLFTCGIASPFALRRGGQALREIETTGQSQHRGTARSGWVLGVIGTVLLGFTVLGAFGVGIATFRAAQSENNERQEARDCARDAQYVVDAVEAHYAALGTWPTSIDEMNNASDDVAEADPIDGGWGWVEPEWVTLAGGGSTPPAVVADGTRCEDEQLPQPHG